MSQQVGIALGTPIMSAIATGFATATLLPGLRAAIGVNAALCLVAALLIAAFLHLPRASAATHEAPEPQLITYE